MTCKSSIAPESSLGVTECGATERPGRSRRRTRIPTMPTALITGASSGIGREFADQLADQGYDLVIVARRDDALQQTRSEIETAHHVRVEVLVADLNDRAQLQIVADRLSDADRPIDLLVNNAGFGLAKPFLDNPVEDEERLLNVLVRATLVLSHAAGNAMRTRGSGRIINVSSVAGWMASGTYAAAKSWVTVFSESLAGQLTGTGVTVTAVCPGFVHTDFHAAGAIDRSSTPGFMWVPSEDVVAEGLAAAQKGKTISVPGTQYKVLTTLLRAAPRPLIRSRRIASTHRNQE